MKWLVVAGLAVIVGAVVVAATPDRKVRWPRWRREIEKILTEMRK